MKFNHDMLDMMRKASALLKSTTGTDAKEHVARTLNRVLPAAAAATKNVLREAARAAAPRNTSAEPNAAPMKDINPRPQQDSTPEQPTQRAAPHDAVVPDFVADLLQQFGLGLPGRAREVPNDAAQDLHARASGQFLSGSLTNAAGTRKYKLYIPAAYTGQALPLVVMLHGCTQNPDDFAAGTEMNAHAEQSPCLVLYPAQSDSANSSRCWNWFNAIDQQREQGEPSIIADMTREVIERYQVDRKQVYVAGLSAGGAMAAIMGNTYPELYAAVGIHSGLPYAAADDLGSALQAMRAGASGTRATHASDGSRPIIVFHGDRDHTVHPRNGEQLIAQHVGAHSHASVERGSVPGGHRYTRTLHRNRDGEHVAEQWLIHGAGHAWSGGSNNGSYTDTRGPRATHEMMRFFATQRG